MFVRCVCCVLSGRGLCDGLITRPEESYRLWRVVECDQETSCDEEAIARSVRENNNNNNYYYYYIIIIVIIIIIIYHIQQSRNTLISRQQQLTETNECCYLSAGNLYYSFLHQNLCVMLIFYISTRMIISDHFHTHIFHVVMK
jgi:hypothetical protein